MLLEMIPNGAFKYTGFELQCLISLFIFAFFNQ